jgi:hypothetical protein
MERFAFIIHPMDPRRDLARLNPLAAAMPDAAIELAYTKIPPFVASHIVGIKSKTGAEAEGWFIACPMTPKQLLGLPPEDVYDLGGRRRRNHAIDPDTPCRNHGKLLHGRNRRRGRAAWRGADGCGYR